MVPELLRISSGVPRGPCAPRTSVAMGNAGRGELYADLQRAFRKTSITSFRLRNPVPIGRLRPDPAQPRCPVQHVRTTLRELRRYISRCEAREDLEEVDNLLAVALEEVRRKLAESEFKPHS